MKLRPGAVICGLLVASLLTQPLIGMASPPAATPAVPSSLHLATLMLEDMSASAAKILAKVDTNTLNLIDAEKTAVAEKSINDQIAATLKSDVEVEALRNEARKTAVSEARRAKTDLTAKIMGASTETIDRYGAALKTNPGYAGVSQEFEAAYTRTEKARILTRVVQDDMDQVLASTLKRLNWLNGDGLRMDLQYLKSRVFEGKGDGDKKIKRILMIAGAAIAFVGLATWGIASIKYGNALKKQRGVDEAAYQARKTDLDSKFADLKASLQGQRDVLAASQKAELDALVKKLSDEYDATGVKLDTDEKNFLNSNGYVWMQCNSYTQASSMICNNYDYKVFTGTSTCTVMCYKNVVQNKETLHAAPVCSSAYIPADCYSQAKYDAEYNKAYNQGYNEQEPNGERNGRTQGTADGTNTGHSDGTSDGGTDGYNDGYDKGYNDEYSKSYTIGYKDRYQDGYEDGYNAGYNDGYNSGYDSGYNDGWDSYVPPADPDDGYYDDGYDDGYGFLSAILTPTAPKTATEVKPQFKKGYDEGLRDAKAVLSLQSG